MRRWILALMALLLAGQALAAIDTGSSKRSAGAGVSRDHLQLRCPKCQNNSIADSNAMIAADMRLKVYELMQQGQSKDQIIAYMVARYGHFVSYEPPLTAGTLLLWLVPGLFVIAGVALLVARTRRRGGASAALSEQERQRLAALLNKGED
ncbi:cytochrome c-type biogenesis protein CcmH [Raoultella planticola]|uniref:Cytochrome c-type biogenesis protein n=1 Tax=Raoultella planticola TaxID=575 RepID=A0A5P6A9F8_RAOPL|nr:cytochrome c-type biogenesis protein CcmH [Raoultella planticola]